MTREQPSPYFAPYGPGYDTLENPLLDLDTAKRVAKGALVVGAVSAIIGAILARKGCADVAATTAVKPTDNGVPCDMSNPTPACYQQYQQQYQQQQSSPGLTEQNVGGWMMMGGVAVAVSSVGALIAAYNDGIPLVGAGIGLVLSLPFAFVFAMANTPCGALM